MLVNRRDPYLQTGVLRTEEEVNPKRPKQSLEEFPHKLSKMWWKLMGEFGEVLDYSYCSSAITKFTPEIILQEQVGSKNVANAIIDSVRKSADRATIEISLPREQVRYNPPILIEICDFISIDGYRIGKSIPSALREYSDVRQSTDQKNPGNLIKEGILIEEMLAKHTEREVYGILFRQYGQDYDKKIFRGCKRIPYKVFTAVLYINKDGTPLQ